MKTTSVPASVSLALILLLGSVPLLRAQEPLDPPAGLPGDTMKTLQEIWDKIGELEAKIDALTTVTGSPVLIEMVTVGDAGNAADTTGAPNPAGAVDYEYKIGKYEVTNNQYSQFLNAVADDDLNGLYNASMDSTVRGGITQSGTNGSYTYASKPNMGNKPVIYVSFFDAARFCNWLHNGQPSGPQDGLTTEDGAYTLTGLATIATGSDPTHGANGRNAGALFHLPSGDEWYKAALHEPGASGDDYWLYPTRSDSDPTIATADVFGNIDNDTANIANYDNGADWNGEDGNFTAVGSGGPGSESFYGAADMGGNVRERTERDTGGLREQRGGAYNSSSTLLQSSFTSDNVPTLENGVIGFRVASP